MIAEEAIRKKYPDDWCLVVKRFTRWAGKHPRAEVGKHAVALAKQAAELAATTKDHASLPSLAKAFAALAALIPAEEARKQAAALDKVLGDWAGRDLDPKALSAVAQSLLSLAPWLSREQRERSFGLVAPRLARSPTLLTPLCNHLSDQQLIALLKQPACNEQVRSEMLKSLASRFKQHFRDVWDLVDHVEQHAPHLDCSSPLVRETLTPRAGKAATKDDDP
jgi:hypothetical protein